MALRRGSPDALIPPSPADHPDGFIIEVDHAGAPGTPRVRLSGELGMMAASDLQQRLEGLLRDGAHSLVVDMTDVSFCDVTCLNALLRVQARLPTPAARLTVLSPCHSLEIMVAALGLEHRLHLVAGRVPAECVAARD